jgi:hypothetical protein
VGERFPFMISNLSIKKEEHGGTYKGQMVGEVFRLTDGNKNNQYCFILANIERLKYVQNHNINFKKVNEIQGRDTEVASYDSRV